MTKTGNPLQIFTFDREIEKKSGTLTMSIFTLCMLVFPLIFMAIIGIGLSLGGYLLSEMTSISIADGAINDQLNIIEACLGIVTCVLFFLVPTYGVPALRQLLFAYALLEDGRMIKMKWKFRRVHAMGASVIAERIANATSSNRATSRQAVSGIFSFLDGLDMMHNPLVIANHLNGSVVSPNIISIPLDNISVLKRTKKKLIIMADTLVKNKPKRKKITIYCMYCDMDTLYQLCERGGSVVNQ